VVAAVAVVVVVVATVVVVAVVSAAVAGGAAGLDDPAEDGAAVAVAADKGVDPEGGVAATVVGDAGAAGAAGLGAGGGGGENGGAHQGGEEQAEQFHDFRTVRSSVCFCFGISAAATSLLIDSATSDGSAPALFRTSGKYFPASAFFSGSIRRVAR
jgi:hypothetical protein